MGVHNLFPDCQYLYVVDDSGDFAPVVKISEGKFITRKPHPSSQHGAVGSFIIRKGAVAEFSAEWVSLQLRIQREIGLPYLPPIHMRLMWARNPKSRPAYMTNRRRLRNPYYGTPTAEQIEAWVRGALSIIHKYKTSGALKPIPGALNLQEYAVHWEKFLANEQYHQEYLWLLNKAGKKIVQAYFSAISSPLLDLLSEKMAGIHNDSGSRKGTTGVLFDNTSDVAGFEIAGPLQAMLTGSERKIKILGPIGNMGLKGDVFPLIQASDVIAYFFRRMHDGDGLSRRLYAKYIGDGRRGLLRPHSFQKPRKARVAKRAIKKYNRSFTVGLAQMHYLAYNFALEKDDKGVFRSAVTSPDEFSERIERAINKAGKKIIVMINVSVLKEPHGEEFTLILQNP